MPDTPRKTHIPYIQAITLCGLWIHKVGSNTKDLEIAEGPEVATCRRCVRSLVASQRTAEDRRAKEICDTLGRFAETLRPPEPEQRGLVEETKEESK